jgi:hypothetical protein
LNRKQLAPSAYRFCGAKDLWLRNISESLSPFEHGARNRVLALSGFLSARHDELLACAATFVGSV